MSKSEAWSQKADIYDEMFADVTSQAINPILEACGDLAGQKHLDIACGTGHLVAAAAEAGAISTGIDIAPRMIAVARENYPDCCFQTAVGEDLPYDDNAFDIITCAFGLLHMEHPAKTIVEVKRVLKPGGRFVFAQWLGADDGNEYYDIIRTAYVAHVDDTTAEFLSVAGAPDGHPASHSPTLVKSGFCGIEFERFSATWHGRSADEFLLLLDKLSSRSARLLASQPPPVRHKIEQHIRQLLEQRRRRNQIDIQWQALLISARKQRHFPERQAIQLTGSHEEVRYGSSDRHALRQNRRDLFPSVDEMLQPDALSDVLGQTVDHFRREEVEFTGTSYNSMERITAVFTDSSTTTMMLKHISRDKDWIMHVTHDENCRSVTLWQDSILDELRPHLDHAIVACAREGSNWAMLMHDVSDRLIGEFFTTPQIERLLDSLAGMHAKFWQRDALKDSDLCDAATLIECFGLRAAQRPPRVPSMLVDFLSEGWARLEDGMLEPLAHECLFELQANPQPLLDAVAPLPHTLCHGDFRDLNVALEPEGLSLPVALDWQLAGYVPAIFDVGWFVNHPTAPFTMPVEQMAEIYRTRLSIYLQQEFDDMEWRKMLDLGLLTQTCRFIGFYAYFYHHSTHPDPEWRAFARRSFGRYNDIILKGMNWL